MKLLAIDSSGLTASAAILTDDLLLAEYTVDYKKTHSQTLMPMIHEIARMTELDLNTLDAVAVACGPGSFTGLRIGSATAKGLADVLRIPVIAVPTVDALAYNLWGQAVLAVPIMDARRDQVYNGIYRFSSDGGMEILKEQCAVSIEELLSELNLLGEEATFLGDGVPVFRDRIEAGRQFPVRYAPPHLSRQRAAAVGALALTYAPGEHSSDAAGHRPIYLRKSQAERVREETEKKGLISEKKE